MTTGARCGSDLPFKVKGERAVNSNEAEPSALGCTTSKLRTEDPSPETRMASAVCPTRRSCISPKSKLTTTAAIWRCTVTTTSKSSALA